MSDMPGIPEVPTAYLGADGQPAVRACPVCGLAILSQTAVTCVAHGNLPRATLTVDVIGDSAELANLTALGLGQLVAAITHDPTSRVPGTYLAATVKTAKD